MADIRAYGRVKHLLDTASQSFRSVHVFESQKVRINVYRLFPITAAGQLWSHTRFPLALRKPAQTISDVAIEFYSV